MRVGLVQLRSGTSVARNVEAASALIREAAGQGAEFIATPEMTHLLVRDRAVLEASIREEGEDEGLRVFRHLARELSVHLLIGSLAIRDADTIRNRSLLVGPGGAVTARYDKMHMFDVTVSETERWRESGTYRAGDAPMVGEVVGQVVGQVGDAKLGMAICYDLRFAELFRYYARAGAQLITVPAAFTVPTGRAHWEVLLRARAIETGAFILAPAQGGLHEDGRTTYGHSLVVSPWGEVVAEFPDDEPGVLIADLDLAEVDKARARIPAWGMEPRI